MKYNVKLNPGDYVSPVFKGKHEYITSGKFYKVSLIFVRGKRETIFTIRVGNGSLLCLLVNPINFDGRWIIRRKQISKQRKIGR